MPESLRASRLDPGKRGALLLTLVAAMAALVAAVGVWWDRPEPRPVQAVSLAQLSGAAVSGAAVSGSGLTVTAADKIAGSTTTSSGTLRGLRALQSAPSRPVGGQPVTSNQAPPGSSVSQSIIVVSVTGAVRKPGLVRLPGGARVADAIEKAGGTTAQANLTGLNLAQKLSDGASVVVAAGPSPDTGAGSAVSGGDASTSDGLSGSGSGTASASGSGTGARAGKVDLNTADVAALDALPGVGPVTAASIVSWREKNGRFSSVEQLQEIPGIGPAKYASLSPLVTV